MTLRKYMATGLACLCVTSLALAADSTSSSSGSTSGSASTQTQQPAFIDAKSLMDVTIKNPQGDDIGKIHNVLFNPQTSEFFATVDAGSGRYAVVPWKVLTISESTSSGSKPKLQVTMNTTKGALRAAPTLSEKQETQLNNPAFLQTVYQHYKVQPPSAMGGSEGTSGSSSGTGGSSGSTGTSGSDTNNTSSGAESQPGK